MIKSGSESSPFNMFNGILFQQSLQDLVKGIRAHRRDEDEYIRSKVAEIGDESRGADMAKKTTAVLKLTYLQMMGHSVSFASFHIVEVMSSPLFASKRIGYLAAAQSFSPTTDVLLLTTNQFKKDLTNGKLQDCSQALTCLGKLVTEELGRDLEHDVSLLLSSPRPYIRKKALLVLYRLIMVHPETLPVVSDRFRACLSDKDPGVACAAVTVTCELARAAPESFLSLAPVLYQLLTSKDSNNWMLIKIVKLMGVLTPLEPRLGKKLIDPLTSLMRTTRAKSLLYECCSTVTTGLMAYPEAVELCAQRLGEFMDESDQNLKYLGLLSMKKLIQAHPHLALEHRDNIMDCLDDEDIGIRMRALELIAEFITKRTLRDVSRILLKKLRKSCGNGFNVGGTYSTSSSNLISADSQPSYSPLADQEAPYRDALARQLLRPGEYRRSTDPSKAGYEMLTTGDDFAWYATAILGGLAELPWLSENVRELIGAQLLELTSRVEALRPVTVKLSEALLLARAAEPAARSEASIVSETSSSEAQAHEGNGEAENESAETTETGGENKSVRNVGGKTVEDSASQVRLSSSLAGSTAWILGEYAELIQDYVMATKALITFPRKVLDAGSQVRVLTAAMKVYVACSDGDSSSVYQSITEYVRSLVDSQFAEVQERAWFFKSILSNLEVQERHDLAPLFEGKLIPVDHRAQSRIPIADDLDLDQPLLDTGSESLLTYLLKTMGTEEEGEDTGDDDESLFKEAIFANTTLSFTGASATETSAASSAQSTLLAGLPSTNKEQNPFYLNTEAKSVPLSTTSPRSDLEDSNAKYGYQTGLLSSEAAVVIKEDRPFGLPASDDENHAEGKKPANSNTRMQAAFQGAFDSSGASRPGKEEKKKKKKKKKDGKEKKSKAGKVSGANGAQVPTEVSLIDFGDETSTTPVSGKESASNVKDLADSLLM